MNRTIATIVAVAVLILCSSQGLWASWIKWPKDVLWSIFESIEEQGPTDKNIKRLEEFLDAYYESDVTEEALIRLARILIDKKDFERAALYCKKLVDDFPESPYRDEALYLLGYSNYRMGNIADASSALTEVIDSPSSTLTQRVRATIILNTIADVEELLSVPEPPYLVGAALPLKGAYRRFGEKALRGVLLAAEVFNKDGRDNVEIKVINTVDTEEPLGSYIESLSYDKRFGGIIGPLLSKNAPEVARIAQQSSIPVIALSQKEGLTQMGDFIFRNFLTPRAQAETIARYAVDVLGKQNFAILYPDNHYGRALAREFRRSVEELGATVVGQVSYSPGKKDFAQELKTLFAIEVEEHVVGRRHLSKYTPTVEVDALYIPDYYPSIVQIAPYLAFYNIKDVQLLGSNGWNSPRLPKLAGQYVEGAVFVDGFFAKSKRWATEEFVKRFRKTYGYTPGIIEAQAYDAAMILFSAIESASMRIFIKESIKSTIDFEGATGNIRFSPDGEAIKELFLLKIEDRKIVEIEDPWATIESEQEPADDTEAPSDEQ